MSDEVQVQDQAQTEKPKRRTVSDTDFVLAWRDSTSVSQVAEKLGLKDASVRQRFKLLVAAGVPLPKFARKKSGGKSKKVVDVVNLTALLNQVVG